MGITKVYACSTWVKFSIGGYIKSVVSINHIVARDKDDAREGAKNIAIQSIKDSYKVKEINVQMIAVNTSEPIEVMRIDGICENVITGG